MAATAIVHANTGVVAAFQITPSTQVAELLSEWKRTGYFKGEFALLNGEDDAFSACIGAILCGARTVGPSCSQGLLYGAQPIHFMSGSRCPIVIPVANRAISAPVNIHADHSDAMPFRDSGGIMFFAKNAQEVYDLMFIAFKTGEDERVQLPVWVNYDGFEISHTTVINKVMNDEGVSLVREYIGPYYKRPYSMLDMTRPAASGGLILPNYFMEVKYSVEQGMQNSAIVAKEAAEFYSKNFWPINPFVEEYELGDAEFALVVMGSRFGTVKEAVRQARLKGKKVGALRVVSFRPFPIAAVREMLSGKTAIAVLDRMGAYGTPMAPLCENIEGTLANISHKPLIRGFVDSLGGRTLTVEQVLEIIQSMEYPEKWKNAIRPTWIGVAGGDTI